MRLPIALTFLLNWLCQHSQCISDTIPSCYPVTVPMCSEYYQSSSTAARTGKQATHRKSKGKRRAEEVELVQWRYNATRYPSFADDKSPSDASSSLNNLYPLVSTECSEFIKVFLCSVHAPLCTAMGVVPPCRELCERVRKDCKAVADAFDIEWPEVLHCDSFPRHNPDFDCDNQPPVEAALPASHDNSQLLVNRAGPVIWSEILLADRNLCIPPSTDYDVTLALDRLDQCGRKRNVTSTEAVFDFGVSCPSRMRVPPEHYGYTFMGLPNCSAPCPNMYLEEHELWTVRYFILAIAVICFVVTTFTLLTFLIDTERFRYPERPIVFYAFSYLVVSSVFLFGFALGERAACHSKVLNENNEVVQGYAVVEGAGSRLCSLMFMILYYFTVSGTIWWLILTITWLLAAGFSWGSEAIEERHLYYHAAAWGIPALQTLLVFIFNKFEGDNIAGVCYVGIYDSSALHYFILLPMCVYLLTGIVNLFLGFFYLNRVRRKLGGDRKNKEKLAKFMLRIGVFSILYIIPQVALIVVYAIEDGRRKYWEATWYVENCVENGVPCPTPSHPIGILAQNPEKPGAFIFCIKYLMTLIVALPPLFWVASGKTIDYWKMFVKRSKKGQTDFNTTQTRLLNDTDSGPHARDRQAQLEEKRPTQDLIFGKMATAAHHGSSASVAAQVTSKQPKYALQQQQWEDLTDSESTSYYTTSSLDSEMSRLLAFESQKNRGVRVTGRKGQQMKGDKLSSNPLGARSDGRGYMKQSRSFPDPRTEPKCRFPETDTIPFTSKRKPETEKFLLESSRKLEKDSGVNPTDSASTDAFRAAQPVNRPHAAASTDAVSRSTPTSTAVNSAISNTKSATREKNKKPQVPPPPPPRVDSVSANKNQTPERVLSI